jgi:hypothetical protein
VLNLLCQSRAGVNFNELLHVVPVWAQGDSVPPDSIFTFDCPNTRRKSKTVDILDIQKVNNSGFDLEWEAQEQVTTCRRCLLSHWVGMICSSHNSGSVEPLRVLQSTTKTNFSLLK